MSFVRLVIGMKARRTRKATTGELAGTQNINTKNQSNATATRQQRQSGKCLIKLPSTYTEKLVSNKEQLLMTAVVG